MTGDFEWRLTRGEHLVWTGQPGQGLRVTPGDALLIPFSLMWGGFAIFWEAMVWAQRAPILFKLWGIPFVLVGLYLIFGRFFADAWLRRRTHYAVTDQRVLIARNGPFAKLTALSLNRRPEMQLSPRANGSGTITFGQNTAPWMRGFPGWPGAGSQAPQFVAIDNAHDIFDRIQQTARRAIVPATAIG